MNLLEKFFYVSLGLTADLSDKLNKTLDSLVKESKITEIDAKKITDDFKKSTEQYAKDIKEKFDELLKKSLANFQYVSQRELDQVRKRIEELEKKISE